MLLPTFERNINNLSIESKIYSPFTRLVSFFGASSSGVKNCIRMCQNLWSITQARDINKHPRDGIVDYFLSIFGRSINNSRLLLHFLKSDRIWQIVHCPEGIRDFRRNIFSRWLARAQDDISSFSNQITKKHSTSTNGQIFAKDL